jgi:hypothetical protein
MSDTQYKHKMLRMIAQAPRELAAFTDAEALHLPMYPRQAERLVALMLTDGWIRERGGHYHLTPAGREELNRPTTAAEPRTYGSASTKGAYIPKPWTPARAGADDHKQHRSLLFAA